VVKYLTIVEWSFVAAACVEEIGPPATDTSMVRMGNLALATKQTLLHSILF
jgi:hypothetical protein